MNSQIRTVATGIGVFQIEVVRENSLAWGVRCQAADCPRVIDVNKIRDGLVPRGCIDHPPTTWKQAPSNG